MSTDQLANALTSTLIGPTLGACFVLVAWFMSLIQDGTSFREQARHALEQLKPAAIPGLVSSGLAMMAGEPWQVSAAIGVSAALTAAGFRLPR
jgi:hypothetical protein